MEYILLGIIVILLGFIIFRKLEIREVPQKLTEEEKRIIEQERQLKAMEIEQFFSEEKEKGIKAIEKEIELYKQQRQKDIEIYNELNLKRIKEIDIEYEEYKNSKLIQKKEIDFNIAEITKEITAWKSRYESAIETYKNFEILKDAENYYKLSLSSEEKDEINELNLAIKKLKNPIPFYKAVYEIYFKNKVNDLVIRVVGNLRVSGIYKITNVINGKCYVGQSVDIGERWKQHCKRGCGIDPLASNKLYPAMMEFGLENFTFEILEKVEDTLRLTPQEKYWQDFYHAKDYGYSIK